MGDVAGRLKIAVIPAWYPSAAQPMQGLFVRDHVDALAANNDLVVLADDGPRRAMRGAFAFGDVVEDGVRTIRIAYRDHPRGAATAGYIAGILEALRRLTRQGWAPDVLHAHVYYTGLVAALAKARRRIPMVLSEHSSHFLLGTLSARDRLRARLAFRAADVVCPVSPVLERAIRDLGYAGPMTVVPNPVDPSAFRPAPFPDDGTKRLLTVAGLQAVKDIPNLLRACALVANQRRDFLLDIVGDGPERGACEQLRDDLGLSDLVRFHGYEPRDAVVRRLRECHFFVLPSRVETFGVAAVEALAAGRPVVTTDVGVAQTVDRTCGTVVRPQDSQALAGAIDQMASSYVSYDPVAISAWALARFGYPAVAHQWEEVYLRILGVTRSTPRHEG